MRSTAIADVLDLWIADRSLSRRKLAFLKEVHQQAVNTLEFGLYIPETCDQTYCAELDLPQGSDVAQVVASLLDHLEPMGATRHPERLVNVTNLMVEAGVIKEAQAEALF